MELISCDCITDQSAIFFTLIQYIKPNQQAVPQPTCRVTGFTLEKKLVSPHEHIQSFLLIIANKGFENDGRSIKIRKK